MPKFTHTLELEYKPSFRSSIIEGMFDVPAQRLITKTWDVDIPIEEEDWAIGMIVGPSGSGKTTIAKRAFPDSVFFDGLKHENWDSPCFVDDFKEGLDVKQDIVPALSKVGFSSPPSWILPFNALSNGQKFRTEIARLLVETPIDKVLVIDEFTSVVDRQAAKVCSESVQKEVRRRGGKVIAVSCHDDIIDYLRPDWIYYVDTGEFKLTRGILRRPEIKLSVRRVHHSAWRLFAGHHYLSSTVSKSACCYVGFIEGKPVAFAAVLPFPHAIAKHVRKEHRVVVLPDYQGIGIGNKLSEMIAQHYVNEGYVYRSVTSHPAMIGYRDRPGSLWKTDRKPSLVSPQGKTGMMNKTSADRWTASFEYVGTDVELYKRNKINSIMFSKDGGEAAIEMHLQDLKKFIDSVSVSGEIEEEDLIIINGMKDDVTNIIREIKINKAKKVKNAALYGKVDKKAVKHNTHTRRKKL